MRRRVLFLLVLLVYRLILSPSALTVSNINNVPQSTLKCAVGSCIVTPMRERMASLVKGRLPEPEAGLVLGVVMGFKGSLSAGFYRALTNSGTVHMVVASGYNVMIVATLSISVLLFLFRRREAVYLSILVMSFYAWLTGLEVSVMRASLMGGILLLSTTLGRQSRSWWTLFFVVCLMLLVEPSLISSVSFQLSVAATFGVVILAPFLQQKFVWANPALLPMVEKLEIIPTMSAILMTAPIIWFHFGRGSLISPLSNVVILPLVPLLMALGGLMIGVGLLFAPLASFLALPTYAIAHLIVLLVRFFGS